MKNSKPTIAIDIDDVLGAENEAVRQFSNRTYSLNHKPEDYLSHIGDYWGYWEGIWEVDPEEGQRRVQEFLASPEKDEQKLVEGADVAIKKLKANYRLVVVTARKGRQLQTTQPWLENHFPDTFERVEFVATWSKEEKVSKAVICKAIGADYLIDDSPEHCNLAAAGGITALLFGDYGWNREAQLHPGVIRVANWKEVLEYFENEPA